jgi:hypothetical protein
MRSARALLFLLLSLSRPAIAFDTWWHEAATAAAAKQLGFSPDAINLLQFGDFGPDFFGPIYDKALVRVPNLTAVLGNFRSKLGVAARKNATLMHFDNLERTLDSNAKFDYLFAALLRNTRTLILRLDGDPSIAAAEKKALVLIALGGSLHMVQDFYSHSNWIHLDFAKAGVALQLATPWNDDRAPTWYEAKAQLVGGLDSWPIQVKSGVYPIPSPDGAESHNNMCHDTSALVVDGIERAMYHAYPPHPAYQGTFAHMLYAVRTASAAGVEWVQLVEQDPAVAAAIRRAATVDLAREDKRLLRYLEGALWSMNVFSCVTDHFDGERPLPEKKKICDGFAKSVPAVRATGAAGLASPAAFYDMDMNVIWHFYPERAIIETLSAGLGRDGAYMFPR